MTFEWVEIFPKYHLVSAGKLESEKKEGEEEEKKEKRKMKREREK